MVEVAEVQTLLTCISLEMLYCLLPMLYTVS